LGAAPGAVLEVSDQLLFLGVDRDHRLACLQRGLGRLADVMKLRVAVRVPCALAGLLVGLQAIAQAPQQRRHRRGRDPVALAAQFQREAAEALSRPAQRRLGIAARGVVNQPLEI